MRHILLLTAIVAVLAGCNTMVKDTYQKITVETPGAENVERIMASGKNKYRVLAPGEVLVDRAKYPLTVTCRKVGYVMAVETLRSHLDMAPIQMNVLNGALPGAAYDVASNSIYQYPDRVVLPMKPANNLVPLEPRETRVLPEKKRPVVVEMPPADNKVDAAVAKGGSKK